jgi:hypothetical protein
MIKNSLNIIGVPEEEFQEMVKEGFVRLEDQTGEQFPITYAPVMEWPANLLIWPMRELPEGETTTQAVISGSPRGAFTLGVAFVLVLMRYA